MPINLLMEWIKSVFLALSLSHPKTSGEPKPSGKCLLWATLCYCWKYLSLNTEKNETIFHPPGILRSICIARWGWLLAGSILPQPMQSCSLTVQEKAAEQKAIPFIYSGSCWRGWHGQGGEAAAVLGVRQIPAAGRQKHTPCPAWGNAAPESSQSFLRAGRVARMGLFMLIKKKKTKLVIIISLLNTFVMEIWPESLKGNQSIKPIQGSYMVDIITVRQNEGLTQRCRIPRTIWVISKLRKKQSWGSCHKEKILGTFKII